MIQQNVSLGHQWLKNYSESLIKHDAKVLASLFHPGLTFIVNDRKREGSDLFCNKDQWDFIFTKVEFRKINAYNVFEPHQGHLFYHEEVKVFVKSARITLEGHFGDESVINENGQMILINRIASEKYVEEFTSYLSGSS